MRAINEHGLDLVLWDRFWSYMEKQFSLVIKNRELKMSENKSPSNADFKRKIKEFSKYRKQIAFAAKIERMKKYKTDNPNSGELGKSIQELIERELAN